MENVNILTKDIFLCRGPARVTKGDMDAIINAFKNKHTLTINSRQWIQKALWLSNLKRNSKKCNICV